MEQNARMIWPTSDHSNLDKTMIASIAHDCEMRDTIITLDVVGTEYQSDSHILPLGLQSRDISPVQMVTLIFVYEHKHT